MAAREPHRPSRRGGGAPLDFAGGPAARYLLLVGVTVLIAIGLLMAFSASSGEAVIREVSQQEQGTAVAVGQTSSITALLTGLKLSAFESGFMQLAYIAIGAALAFLIARIDYHNFIRFAVPLGLAVIAGLIAVFFYPPVLGAHRWIPIGPLTLQPSELAKPVLLVIGASAFSALRAKTLPGRKLALSDWIVPALFIAVVLALIIVEPDMGTALIVCVGLAGAWLLCDLPLRYPVGLGALGAVVLAARLYVASLLSSKQNYGVNRITSFIESWRSGQTAYQTLQAQYALAGGGLAGVGPGLSRQKYTWLTQAQSDFILAIVGEELGFLGTFAIIASFALILMCGMRIAARAKDRLGRALAGGAIIVLIFQAILNIFAVTSLIPVTGKPLPFVTAGGTSLITSLSLVGIVLSVSRYGGGRPAREMTRPASRFSLIVGGEAPAPVGKRSAGNHPAKKHPISKRPGQDAGSGVLPVGKKAPTKKKPTDKKTPQAGKKPPRKKRPLRRRGADKKEDEHEDSLEWRWDSGAHLSGPGSRR
ncbi:MAG: FtsW/RodA/SpoVE family cell cycle protein [Actinomycetia bacterium]|nr:FtsW/RodA/SpoVE family cell cycle protein [Actinomycetes bacterium]